MAKDSTALLAERYLDQLINEAWHEPTRGQPTEYDSKGPARHRSNPHAKTGSLQVTSISGSKKISSKGKPNPFWVLLTSPIPILSAYVQKKFFFGNFQLVQWVLFGIFSSLSVLFWGNPNATEISWVTVSILSFVFGISILCSWFLSLVGGLKICDIIDKYAEPEFKFVILGLAVVLLGTAFTLFGPPAAGLQRRAENVSQVLLKRGFKETSKVIRIATSDWKYRILSFRE